MKFKLVTFLFLIGFSLGLGWFLRQQLQRSPSAEIVMQGNFIELPLEEYGGHLYISGQLNGTKADGLILDSGADDILISAAKANAIHLKPQGKVRILGESQQVSTQYVSQVVLTLGNLTLKDRQSIVIPSAEVASISQYSGRTLTGIVGYELFEQLVVELDYQQHRLRLHRLQTYQYQGSGHRIPMEIIGDRPYIQAKVWPYGASDLPGRFLIDTGSNGAISVSASCGLDRRLIQATPKTLRRLNISIHGTREIVLGRLQKLQIGPFALDQPLAVFGASTDGECDRVSGKIGNQILRQFRVIFDYPHRQLILEQQGSLGGAQSYDYDLSGLWLEAIGTNLKTYRIGAVYEGTPAHRAGLQPGDIVTHVNGKVAAQFTLAEVRQQLSQSEKRVELSVQRGTKQIRIRLMLQPLL